MLFRPVALGFWTLFALGFWLLWSRQEVSTNLQVPCGSSVDARCPGDLYRGVRWEDYKEGAGCLGDECDDTARKEEIMSKFKG